MSENKNTTRLWRLGVASAFVCLAASAEAAAIASAETRRD
jgi:hypothetical protein